MSKYIVAIVDAESNDTHIEWVCLTYEQAIDRAIEIEGWDSLFRNFEQYWTAYVNRDRSWFYAPNILPTARKRTTFSCYDYNYSIRIMEVEADKFVLVSDYWDGSFYEEYGNPHFFAEHWNDMFEWYKRKIEVNLNDSGFVEVDNRLSWYVANYTMPDNTNCLCYYERCNETKTSKYDNLNYVERACFMSDWEYELELFLVDLNSTDTIKKYIKHIDDYSFIK